MSKKGPPAGSPPDLQQIERTSREFQDLAAEVTDKLNAFEHWFNRLSGKIEVTVWERDDKAGESAYLGIKRNKDGWGLTFGIEYIENEGATMRPLEDASMMEKCRAIGMIPALLDSFYSQQREAVERLKAAAGVFSQLPSAMGGK